MNALARVNFKMNNAHLFILLFVLMFQYTIFGKEIKYIFFWWKNLDLASCTQFSNPNFIDNIHSIIMRSQWNVCFLHSIRPDPCVDLGHINVIELLYSQFDGVLLSSIFFTAGWVVRETLVMAYWSSLFPLEALFGGYLGCL